MYDSDEYDFAPSSSSKLASLFSTSALSQEDSKNSLTYTAPKQPKSCTSTSSITPNVKEEENQSKVQTTAVLAKIVTLWKLERNEYKSLGKHGLAIIGSADLCLYELIAYKEKTNLIIRIKLDEAFSFYNQQNNYSSFYDSNSQNWLVKYNNNDRKQFSDTLVQYGAKLIGTTLPSETNTDNKNVKPDLLPKPDDMCSSVSKTVQDQHSDSSESIKRANILNRIAKMGQQVISNPLGNSSELSDSEQEEPESDRKTPPSRKHRKVALSTISPVHVSRQVVVDPQYKPTQNYYSSTPNEGFSQFLIAQNTELKIHLATISAKLDNLSIGQNLSQFKSNDENLESRIKTLELVNDNLQTALENSEKKYKQLEKSGPENNESIKKVIQLEENIRCLMLELDNLKKHESALTEDLQNQIRVQEDIITNQQSRIKDLEETCETYLQKQNSNKDLGATISSLNEELELLKEKANENTSKNKVDDLKFDNMVKQHMNSMFQSVINNFQDDSMYTIRDIQSKIGKELKKATFKIIEDYKYINYSEEK